MGNAGLTLLRAVWLTLPVTAGPGIEDALDGPSGPVRAVLVVAAFGAWAAGLLALLVPRVASLTVLRVVAPAALGASVVAAVAGGVEAIDLLGVVATLVAVLGVEWPSVGDALVDGSSYGPERRVPLRVPMLLAVVPAPLAIVVVVGGVLVGPLLLACGVWLLGAVALVAGLALAGVAARALHGLSERFLVFVPGGVVVHDLLALAEPVLLPKGQLVAVGPALAGTTATDLTQGAAGLVLELRLRAPVDLVRRRRGAGEVEHVDAVLVSPTRAAVVLDEARERGLPVG